MNDPLSHLRRLMDECEASVLTMRQQIAELKAIIRWKDAEIARLLPRLATLDRIESAIRQLALANLLPVCHTAEAVRLLECYFGDPRENVAQASL